jgi:NAD(P)-dependent dehydrogenase (short-subunit alcohol dehydrogenase family)
MERTALITGGSGGLGVGVVGSFLDDGWRVVVPWVAERELERLPRHEALTLVQADLFEAEPVAEVVDETTSRPEAPLRAVVNLVGGYEAAGRVHETPVEDFERQFRLNLRPTYLVTAATLPALVAAGGGSVVCVGTRAALRPFPGAAGYIASKAAVLAFVQALAVEYRDDGVRANAVLPSVIDTPGNRAAQPDADHSKWVDPADIGRVIRFLCSDECAVVSGAAVPVYGRA